MPDNKNITILKNPLAIKNMVDLISFTGVKINAFDEDKRVICPLAKDCAELSENEGFHCVLWNHPVDYKCPIDQNLPFSITKIKEIAESKKVDLKKLQEEVYAFFKSIPEERFNTIRDFINSFDNTYCNCVYTVEPPFFQNNCSACKKPFKKNDNGRIASIKRNNDK